MKIASMKSFTFKKLSFLMICTLLLTSCDSDDDQIPDAFQGEKIEYDITSVDGSSIEGSLIFSENENGSTTIEVELDGTEEDKTYSPRLLTGNTVDGGELALTLEEIEGDEGKSSLTVTNLDDDSTVSFKDFKEMDGHIVVYLIEEESETPVAKADIGENQLTDESVSYELDGLGDTGISVLVKFQERLNGTTLVTITSDDMEEGNIHPAYIYSGAIGEEQGERAITLNPLEDGMSVTNVHALDGEDGEDIIYEELVEFDGSLNIYLSAEDEETIISQGNIGSNSEE